MLYLLRDVYYIFLKQEEQLAFTQIVIVSIYFSIRFQQHFYKILSQMGYPAMDYLVVNANFFNVC